METSKTEEQKYEEEKDFSYSAKVSGEKFIAEPFGTRGTLQSCDIVYVQTARRQIDHRNLMETH